ncbi:MAG: hypothetical protein IIY93_09930, partial [Clostridia bacterium]|nr:hypothetical protein [Clostridia bacterium]
HIAYYECETCGKRYADGTAAVAITGDITIPALGHDWGMWMVTKPATESEERLEVRICQNDPSHTETRTVPVLGHIHTLTKTKAVAPTCETDGHIAYWICDGCGRYFADAEGKTEINREDTVLKKLGHDWDGGVITVEPTCTEDGVKTFTCRHDASHTFTQAIPATGHSFVLVPAVPAGCETDGHTAYYVCEHCGKLVRDAAGTNEITLADTVLPATGHDWGEPTWNWREDHTAEATFVCTHDAAHILTISAEVTVDTTEPTCETDGKNVYTATAVCDGRTFTDTRADALPALGHDWDEGKVTLAPDCETDGIKTYTCRHDANHFRVEVLPAPGHDWDEGVVTLEPTCEEDGVKTYTCRHDANHTYTEDIPATGHKLRYVAAVEATCETDGHIAYYECEYCGHRYADGTAAIDITDDVAVPAIGHDWGEWHVVTPGTEETEGVEERVCRRDPSHIETRPMLPVEHVHELIRIDAVAAACEADGHIAYWMCDGCGRMFADADGKTEIDTEDIVLKKLGHDWDEGTVTTQPTCEEDGVMTFTCRHDASHTYMEILPALGHDWDEGTVVKAPTSTEPGEMLFTCRHDAGHIYTESIPPVAPVPSETNHEPTVPDGKPAENVYVIAYGAEAHWTQGNHKNLLVTVKRSVNDDLTFDYFLGIQVDGVAISSDDYTATPGSVNVVLKRALLERLEPGTHTLTVLFTDSSVETTFTIKSNTTVSEEKPISDSPKTGEPGDLVIWLLAFGALAVILLTELRERRERYLHMADTAGM